MLAVIRRALPLDDGRYGPITVQTRLVFAAIDGKLLLEITGLPVAPVEIPERSTARADRFLQHRADRVRERLVTGQRDTSRSSFRIDSGEEQRLAGVNVADADDDAGIHDELFHGDAPTVGSLPQILAIELVAERLRAQVFQEPVIAGIVTPVQGAEAPRVPEAQRTPGFEFDVDVIVHARRRIVFDDTDAPGHAEVQDGGAVGRVDQQVFGATFDGRHGLPRQMAVDILADGPPQAALADSHVGNSLTDDMRLDAAATGFDFG